MRPLGVDTARLALSRPLPVRLGDRILIRDPGRHDIVGGADVLDVAPPPLGWRGAAADRGAVLATMDGHPDELDELRRRRVARRDDLERMGIPVSAPAVVGDWLVDAEHWQMLRRRLPAVVAQHARDRPLETGMTAEALRQALDLPDRVLVEALVEPPLVCRAGRVGPLDATLPEPVARAVEQVRADLSVHPFLATDAARLDELRLGARELPAAARVGTLLRLADGVVLLPRALEAAMEVLARLPQPFTVSQARRALGTTGGSSSRCWSHSIGNSP